MYASLRNDTDIRREREREINFAIFGTGILMIFI